MKNKIQSFLSEVIESHKFFVNKSKSFVGIKKEDHSKSYPIFGWITDYETKPFNHENKVWSVSDIGFETYYAYRFKDLLYYPIAYYNFMKSCIW